MILKGCRTATFLQLTVVVLAISLGAISKGAACADVHPQLKIELTQLDQTVADMNADFSSHTSNLYDRTWIKLKLKHMFDVDQLIRKKVMEPSRPHASDSEVKCRTNEIVNRMMRVDAQNTSDMKEILTIHSWIKISEFGSVADNQAWLLVQHADYDPDFQKAVLQKLEILWPLGETNSQNFAYLFDRVASSWSDLSKRVPQRYGTQGACVSDGKWEPLPIDQPSRLEERRAQVGLPPFSEYLEKTNRMCNGFQKTAAE